MTANTTPADETPSTLYRVASYVTYSVSLIIPVVGLFLV